MVGNIRKFIRLLTSAFLLLLVTDRLEAQGSDLFARVSISPREGVVRQPYKVTISVYTSTWYTAPLQFNNLEIEDAFIIPFTRTLSSISYIDRKKYATLSFYYLVFPYTSGTLEIPSLEIIATSPPEGDYKGVARTLRTRPQQIKVDDLPGKGEEGVWMVATDVNYRETWSKDTDGLKVGDVVERRIELDARGTLPALIEPLDLQELPGVSLYPARALLEDRRSDREAGGRRTESFTYLFEEKGRVEISEELIRWWNPETKKLYERRIPGRSLDIGANPDLDLLISLKDSLDALNAANLPLEESGPFPWKKTLAFGGASLLILFILFTLIRKSIRLIIKRREIYLGSEAYYFRRLQKSLRKRQNETFLNRLYLWLDMNRPPGCSPAVADYLDHEHREDWNNFLENMLEGRKPMDRSGQARLQGIARQLRKRVLSSGRDYSGGRTQISA